MKIDWRSTFKNLLKDHVKKGYLRDERVEEVFGNMPLERVFDEDQLKRFVLMDSPALIYFKDQKNARTCSAPHMISMMTSMMELSEYDNVLILGSKGGVIEGVIANLVDKVYILEQVEEVASITEEAFIKLGIQNMWVRNQNPIYGLKEKGPFTKILVTGAVPYIPHVLLDQLAPHGIMVTPLMLKHPQFQAIFKIIKKGEFQKSTLPNYKIINHGGVIFSPLIYEDAPHIDKERDITLETILKYSKDYKKPDLLKLKNFFEELKELPRLDINQVVLHEKEEIIGQINFNQEEWEQLEERAIKLQNNKKRGVKVYPEDFEIWIHNPSKNEVSIDIELVSPNTKQNVLLKEVILQPKIQNHIKFPFKLPLIEGQFTLRITLIGPKDFRLGHAEVLLYMNAQNNSKTDWSVSIERKV